MKVCFFKLEFQWSRRSSQLEGILYGRTDSGDLAKVKVSGLEMFFGISLRPGVLVDLETVIDHIQRRVGIMITRTEKVEAGEYMDAHCEPGTYYLLYVQDPQRSLPLISKAHETDEFLKKTIHLYETEFNLSSRLLTEYDIALNWWYEVPDGEGEVNVRELKKVEKNEGRVLTRVALAAQFEDIERTRIRCISALEFTELPIRRDRQVVFSVVPVKFGGFNFVYNSEEKMVRAFMEWLDQKNFDVFVHHHGVRDLCTSLSKRFNNLGWLIQTVTNKDMTKYNIRHPGHIHIDLVRIEQERAGAREMELDDLCQKYLGEHRGIGEHEEMCVADAMKIARIAEETQIIHEIIETSSLVHMDPQRYINTSQEAKTTSLIQYFGKTLGPHRLLKITTESRTRRLTEEWNEPIPSHPYGGGLILDPVPGIYDKWIVQWDFEGQYPANMIAHNLSTDTILSQHIIETHKLVECFDYTRMKTSQGDSLLVLKNSEGILVKVQRLLRGERRKYKEQMKRANGLELKILDIKQRTIKVLMNSLYGFLGDKTCIFHVAGLSDVIATCGQECLKVAKEMVETMEGVEKVVMGNTDSIAAKIESQKTFEEVLELAWRASDVINAMINADPVRIVPETIWPSMYVPQKKNAYGGFKIPIPGSPDQAQLSCVGMWNRAMCPFIVDSLREMIEALTMESKVDPRILLINVCERVVHRLTNKTISFADLIFRAKINQDLENYGQMREVLDSSGFTKIKMAHDVPVTIAMKRKRDEHLEFVDNKAGAVFPYVLVTDISGVCDVFEAWTKNYSLDMNQYKKRLEQVMLTQLGSALEILWPNVPREIRVRELLHSNEHIICHSRFKSKRLMGSYLCLNCGRMVLPQCSKIPGFCPSCTPDIPSLHQRSSQIKMEIEECYQSCNKCEIEKCKNVMCPVFHKLQPLRKTQAQIAEFFESRE